MARMMFFRGIKPLKLFAFFSRNSLVELIGVHSSFGGSHVASLLGDATSQIVGGSTSRWFYKSMLCLRDLPVWWWKAEERYPGSLERCTPGTVKMDCTEREKITVGGHFK